MMTNNQCYYYAVKAISNIIKSDEKLTPDTFYIELYRLWDIYGEEEIERQVRKEENLGKINFEIQ